MKADDNVLAARERQDLSADVRESIILTVDRWPTTSLPFRLPRFISLCDGAQRARTAPISLEDGTYSYKFNILNFFIYFRRNIKIKICGRGLASRSMHVIDRHAM